MKIAIIGGGIAGCVVANELKNDYEVHIFEQGDDLMTKTSGITPNRMGLGFHYSNIETAKFYLDNTLNFLSEFPFLKKDYVCTNGEYFIMKESIIKPQEVIAVYKELNNYYQNKPFMDKIFGNNLILDIEYNPSNEVFAKVTTRETIFDFEKFRKHIKNQLKSVLIKYNTNIDLLEYNNIVNNYDLVINCTWQNIEKFNNYNIKYTNREKVLIEIKLNEKQQNLKCKFFCFGAFAMFTNCGNGYGKITYAPETNLINKNYNDDDLKHKILNGAIKYIPELEGAQIVNLQKGIVKSIDEVNIYDEKSPFHKRNYSGLDIFNNKIINNAAIKLSYSYNNAIIIKNYVKSKMVGFNDR